MDEGAVAFKQTSYPQAHLHSGTVRVAQICQSTVMVDESVGCECTVPLPWFFWFFILILQYDG